MSSSSKVGSRSTYKLRSPAEWVTFAIALTIVSILVGLVLFVWVTQDHQPPLIDINISQEIRKEQGRFYVPFTVKNTGGGTAESVQVLGELKINGEVEESGEQQIDFLSSGESEQGAFVFTQDPRQGNLSIRVASYKLP